MSWHYDKHTEQARSLTILESLKCMTMNKNAIHPALMFPLEVQHVVGLQRLVSRATLTFSSREFSFQDNVQSNLKNPQVILSSDINIACD